MTTEAVEADLRETIFSAEGVLPSDQPLPKFSLIEEKMGMSYRDWMNSYLARLAVFCADTEAVGERPSLRAFHNSQAEARGHTLSRLGSAVARAAGIQVSRGAGGLKDVSPRLLTPEEAEEALRTWKRTYRPAGANANDKNGEAEAEVLDLSKLSLLTRATISAFSGRFPDHPAGITLEDVTRFKIEAFPRSGSLGQPSLDDIRKSIAKDLHNASPESRRVMLQELVELAGGCEAVVDVAEQLEHDLHNASRLDSPRTVEPGLEILSWLAVKRRSAA